MNKLFPIFFIFALTFMLGAEKHETQIVGYAIGDSALEADIQEQLNNMKDEVSKEISKSENDNVRFYVVGAADTLGKKSKDARLAENDQLALQRALNVKSFLQNEFPSAIVNAVSSGEKLNAREVIVSWEVIPSNPTKGIKSGNKYPSRTILGSGIVTCLLIAGLVIWSFFRTKPEPEVYVYQGLPSEDLIVLKTQVDEIASRLDDARLSQSIPSTKIVRLEGSLGLSGGEFEIDVLFEKTSCGEKWTLPFKSAKDGGFIIKTTIRDARECVKSCIKEARHEQEVQELVRTGTIKLKGKEEIVT